MQPQQIDDDDPRVQYSPGWSQDDSPGSFDSSLHGSATPGSTATLTFTGTSVEVHGIVMNTRQHPTMTFTVDGGSTSTYPAPTVGNKNSMLFFSASGLSSDQHRLVITNQDGGGPIALWLDFFIVTPPQGPPPGNPPPGHTHSDPPTSPNSSNTPRSTSTSTSQVNPAPTISPADPPSTPSDTSSAPNANSTQSLPVSTSSESSSGSDSDSGSSTASGSQSTIASSKPSSSTSSPRSGSPTSVSPSAGSVASGSDTARSSRSYRSLPDNASSTTPGAFASSTSTLGGDPVTPAVTDTAHAASRPNVGPIIGGVIGALVVLLLLILALFLYRRRLKKRGPTFIYPFTMEESHARDDRSEVGTVATTAEGILTTWAPEMFQVPSGSTVNLAPGPQPSLPRPAPVDIPHDVLAYSPSAGSAFSPMSSNPLVHQSMGSVDVVDVSFVRSPVSPEFEQLSPVESRGSWPAI